MSDEATTADDSTVFNISADAVSEIGWNGLQKLAAEMGLDISQDATRDDVEQQVGEALLAAQDDDEQEPTTVGHWSGDDCDTYIGRGYDQVALGDVDPGEKGWLGNPWTVEECDGGREEAIARYNVAFKAKLRSDEEFRSAVAELQGDTLGCWCQAEQEDPEDDDTNRCHGEVIAHYVDQL